MNGAAATVTVIVIAVLFFGCGGELRHIAGEERDYDPGENGDDFVRIGSIMKPVDTEWQYRISKITGEMYEVELTVIAVTDSSYKLRERREGYPDVEYYYEYGPETDDFVAISLYEVYTVGGERVTHRYSPPQIYLPGDGYLREGLTWSNGPIKVEETTMGRSERFEHDFEMPGVSYKAETTGRVETPAGEFVVAPLVKISAEGTIMETDFISNIGTVKKVSYDAEGFAIETWELLNYSYPGRDCHQ
jgi:hypothetical protein